MIINEDFFDNEDVTIGTNEPEIKTEKHFTHTINMVVQIHSVSMPIEKYKPEERERLGNSLMKFENRIFKCLDLFDIEHSEHFMICSQDYINLKDKKLHSYDFGPYVLNTEPNDYNNCIFFFCYVNFSNIPLKKFVKFYMMCGHITAQLFNYSKEKPIAVSAHMYKLKNKHSDWLKDSPCVDYWNYIGGLSGAGTIKPPKVLFFETIKKLYPDVTYGKWLEMFTNDGIPSDAPIFETDNKLLIQMNNEQGVKSITKFDYIENPDFHFEKNNYHMGAVTFEQSQSYERYAYKGRMLSDANVFDFPELDNRNFTLFCLNKYSYGIHSSFYLILFFDGTIIRNNKEYTVMFKSSSFYKNSIDEFIDNIKRGKYYDLVTGILHAIYNNPYKEIDILNKIKQIET